MLFRSSTIPPPYQSDACWPWGDIPAPPRPPHSFTICHKTEVMRNTLNPVWPAFAIPVRALCNGDYDR